MEKLLTAKQVSELFQVKISTVYAWTHMEFIPHYKLGKCVRFSLKDIEAWLKKRCVNGQDMMKYQSNSSMT